MVKIFVLIKQVPKLHNPDVDRTTGAIIRMDIENVINPDDFYALELGLSLKDQYGGTVTVVTMGPPQAEYALREALAMGCDDGMYTCNGMDDVDHDVTLTNNFKIDK